MVSKEQAKSWGSAAAVAALVSTALAALGFSTPSKQLADVKATADAATRKNAEQDVSIAVNGQKLDDAIIGINRLLDAQGLSPVGKPHAQR